jgi:hypothetical protein
MLAVLFSLILTRHGAMAKEIKKQGILGRSNRLLSFDTKWTA